MPIPLTALFAAAVHQVRSEVADPSELEQSVALLAQAAGFEPVQYEVAGDQLLVNNVPIPPTAPGAALLLDAFRRHHTSRLELPAGLSPRQWHDVAELYASAPGLYATIDQLRDALRASVPAAVVSAPMRDGEVDLREALFELPGLRTSAPPGDAPQRASDAAVEARMSLASQLDPLLASAQQAHAARDFPALARAVLGIRQLEAAGDDERRAMVANERRRYATVDVLDEMVRLLTEPTTPAVVEQAVLAVGRDGTEALLRALNGAGGPHDRRVYIELLVRVRAGDDAIQGSLTSARAALVRDVTEVAGRRHMAQAVPALTQLLRHREPEVRTAAWHALEQIGTREAVEALTAGR